MMTTCNARLAYIFPLFLAFSFPFGTKPTRHGSLNAMATSSQPTLVNRRRYINAFLPVSVDEGTHYPCSKEDIRFVTAEISSKDSVWQDFEDMRARYKSAEEATIELERFLLPTKVMSDSALDALKRLQNMLLLEDEGWGPDLVVKTCHDWDKVFFNRRLKRRVNIFWMTERSFDTDSERGAALGTCGEDEFSRGRSEIHLNADGLLLLPPSDWRVIEGEPPVSQFRCMWSVLLHAFCHAYLQISTGADYCDYDDARDGYDMWHGQHFQRCAYAVDGRTRELLGIGVGKTDLWQTHLPVRIFDVENHVVEPETGNSTERKGQGCQNVIEKCWHGMRRMTLRKKGMSNRLTVQSYTLKLTCGMCRYPETLCNKHSAPRSIIKV